jgi:hypothetical protein
LTHSKDVEIPRLSCSSSYVGDDVEVGQLDLCTIWESTNNLLHNWDISYPLFEYYPHRKFDGDINPNSNWQILKKQFNQIPLIKKLVDTFVEKYPYVSVDMVWILQKEKSGDGFQAWHQDLAVSQRIFKTIVVNLRSKEL